MQNQESPAAGQGMEPRPGPSRAIPARIGPVLVSSAQWTAPELELWAAGLGRPEPHGGWEVQDAKTLRGAPSALLEVKNSELLEDVNPSLWGRRGGVGLALPLGARRAVPLPPPPTPQGCGGGRWQGGWGIKMAAWRLGVVWLAARGGGGLWGERCGGGEQKGSPSLSRSAGCNVSTASCILHRNGGSVRCLQMALGAAGLGDDVMSIPGPPGSA